MTKVCNKRQKPEKVRKKTKKIPLCGKRQKFLTTVPPFLEVFAGVEVSCRIQTSKDEVNVALFCI
jgi:hypothetical protein